MVHIKKKKKKRKERNQDVKVSILNSDTDPELSTVSQRRIFFFFNTNKKFHYKLIEYLSSSLLEIN